MIEILTRYVLPGWLALTNIVAFIAYGVDKGKAKLQKRRISEATLITLALIGGSIGAFLGMQIFRHKTQKPKFKIGVPLIILLHCLIAVAVIFLILRK